MNPNDLFGFSVLWIGSSEILSLNNKVGGSRGIANVERGYEAFSRQN